MPNVGRSRSHRELATDAQRRILAELATRRYLEASERQLRSPARHQRNPIEARESTEGD